jgi:hypothetical protein
MPAVSARRILRRLAALGLVLVYWAVSLPFALSGAVLCLALFYLFTWAQLRLGALLGAEDGLAAALVAALMFLLFVAVYLGELPALVAGVKVCHGRLTDGLARRIAALWRAR